MSDKEKPLPKPPTKAFGRKTNFEHQEEPSSLVADRMAQAAAEGRLDEFLKQEMPDNEYARNLAGMMMGMTGMMPDRDSAISSGREQDEKPQDPAGSGAVEPQGEVPEDVRQAIMEGDMQSLMALLKREHEKRNPESPLLQAEERAETTAYQQPSAGMPAIDKEIIDAMVEIAKDNSVTLDWIILRAIKVYVQEYRKTGKL